MTHLKKSLILSFALVCISSLQLHAQSSNLWLGVRAGVDLGKFSFDPALPSEETVGTKTGITAGGELDYWFSDMMGITAQLLYTQKGLTEDIADAEFTASSSFTIAYLQIPVLLKVAFGSGSIKPYIFAGPEVGIKISTSQKLTEGGKTTTPDVPDSEFASTNLGIMAGAGVSYTLNSSTMIFLDAAYDHGLSNLNGTSTKDKEKGYTRDYRICVGILFRLGD